VPHVDHAQSVLSWFAVAVKPRQEKLAARVLRDQGLEDFLPLYRSRRRWSDRLKEIEVPLFAGYVFCRFGPQHRKPVLRTPGVRSIVEFGGQPAPVPDAEISALRQAAGSGLPVEPWPLLGEGQPIRIERGPLSGLHGIVVRARDTWRVVVSVRLLQRSVAVEVDREDVARVRESMRWCT
jgi:transcription antitermination factor NusG